MGAIKLPDTVYVERELQLLMKDFFAGRLRDCEALEKALGEKNWSEIARIGHIVAGVSGGYGFEELGEIGYEIETMGHQQKIEGLTEMIHTIRNHIKTVTVVYK